MSDNLVGRWILIAAVIGVAAWVLATNPLNYGIDLKGGVSLTYAVDLNELGGTANSPAAREEALNDTIRVISTRINKLGVKDINVRREGEDRIKIQAPQMSDAELRETKQTMTQLGDLTFPIVLSESRQGRDSSARARTYKRLGPPDAQGNPTTIDFRWNEEEANTQRKAAIDAGKAFRGADGVIPREVRDAEGKTVRPYRNATRFQLSDAAGPLPIFWVPDAPRQPSPKATPEQRAAAEEVIKALALARQGREHDETKITGAWIYEDPEFFGETDKLDGRDITDVRASRDMQGMRTVNYTILSSQARDFSDYTERYLQLPMGLVLNDELWSAPTLNGRLSGDVEITGGSTGFTEEESRFIINCLQSGSLRLRPTLESEEDIGATLGAVAIDRGIWASIIGAILILFFMVWVYRVSGLIAVLALSVNLGLLMAMLAFFGSTLTLPGIAGIVLTIGMAVDASILIFERIREEMEKNKTLASAVKAGFDRAFVTILDSNITTIITGIILYQYGVGPIRGFAVTLIMGIIASLFTALTFSRACFLILLRDQKRTTLSMRRLVSPDIRIDFVKHARRCAILSSIVVVVSLGLFAITPDAKKYGLDFTGGTVFRVNFEQKLSSDELKARLQGLKDAENRTLLSELEVTQVKPEPMGSFQPASSFEVKVQTASRVTATEVAAVVKPDLAGALGARLASTGTPSNSTAGGPWIVEFALDKPASIAEIKTLVSAFAPTDPARAGRVPYENARFDALDPSADGESASRFQLLVSETDLGVEDQLRAALHREFAALMPKEGGIVNDSLALPKVNYIGPNVVADLKQNAVVAVVLSLLALVAYLWFRFRNVKYGIGAAIAVFHDVIVALGAVVLVNSLGVIHVPLSLATIAGFLTIIGYSLNDTIVIFDRVRENLGNVKGTYSQIVNISINQTLSRTVLTALTTFFVVVVLLVMNLGQESPIEGIAFTLLIGVVVGTYSTIFIAAPFAIWMTEREAKRQAAGAAAPARN